MKKDQLKVFIVACLVITVCAFGYVSYAFYQSQFSGTATGTLAAKWEFDFLGKDAEEGTFQSLKGTSYTIDLSKSCKNCVSTGSGENVVYKLQPGSTGKFSVKVDASSSAVKTHAKIVMNNLTMGGTADLPTGLKFYVINGDQKVELAKEALVTAEGASIFDNSATPWAADTAGKTAEKTIEWEWTYATGNDNKYNGKTVTFGLKAVAEQVA